MADVVDELDLLIGKILNLECGSTLFKSKLIERSLYTDALAIISITNLYLVTLNEKYLKLSEKLVAEVHSTHLSRFLADETQDIVETNDSDTMSRLSAFGKKIECYYLHHILLWIFSLNRMSHACYQSNMFGKEIATLVNAVVKHFIRDDEDNSITDFSSTDVRKLRRCFKRTINKAIIRNEGTLDGVIALIVFELVFKTGNIAYNGSLPEISLNINVLRIIRQMAIMRLKHMDRLVCSVGLNGIGNLLWVAAWLNI
ncbi:hypothetical protein ACOME3_009307 [Neoechinorhynchus agilis]